MPVNENNITSNDANAIIDSALLDAQSGGDTTSGHGPDTLLSVSLTPEEEAASEKQGKAQLAVFKEEAALQKAQEDMLGKEQAEALRKEQAAQKARDATLLGTAEKLLNRGKGAASNANLHVGNFPTPGSVGFPLVLLAIFFFVLVSFNGNTRLNWLWLVLTNNAYVGSSVNSSASPSSSSTGNSSGPNYVPAVQVPATPIPAFTLPAPSYAGGGMGSPY